MTLSRRSFLGRGLALVGGAVAAVKLGGAPKRAEAVSTTADLAALQQAERDAHPLYAVTVKPAPTSVVMTDFLEGVCASYRSGWEASFLGLLGGDEVSGAGAPYTHTFTPRYDDGDVLYWLDSVPNMCEWLDSATASHAPGAQYTPTDYGGTWTFPRNRSRHTRLLFAEPRRVKRRG